MQHHLPVQNHITVVVEVETLLFVPVRLLEIVDLMMVAAYLSKPELVLALVMVVVFLFVQELLDQVSELSVLPVAQ